MCLFLIRMYVTAVSPGCLENRRGDETFFVSTLSRYHALGGCARGHQPGARRRDEQRRASLRHRGGGRAVPGGLQGNWRFWHTPIGAVGHMLQSLVLQCCSPRTDRSDKSRCRSRKDSSDRSRSRSDRSRFSSDHDLDQIDHDLDQIDHDLVQIDHDLDQIDHDLVQIDHDLDQIDHDLFQIDHDLDQINHCLLYTSPSPRDKRQSRMPSSA